MSTNAAVLKTFLSSALLVLTAPAWAASVVVQVVDSAGQPALDAVVYAEPDGASAPKVMRAAEIEQKARKFMPLVTVVQTGSVINFPNNDTVRHHIYSFSPAKKFDQKLYSGVAASPVTFDKAGTVVLGCNIHDKMVAYVQIVDTPYFAKTDAAGKARIELPAGKYQIKVWHYNLQGAEPAPQAVTTKGAEAATVSFKLSLKPVLDDKSAGKPASY